MYFEVSLNVACRQSVIWAFSVETCSQIEIQSLCCQHYQKYGVWNSESDSLHTFHWKSSKSVSVGRPLDQPPKIIIDCVMVQQTVFDSSPLAYQDGSNMEKDNRDSLFKIAHPPKIMLKFFKSIKAEAFLLTFGFSDKTLHSLNTWKAILHFLVQ